jgi:hypothetical protein
MIVVCNQFHLARWSDSIKRPHQRKEKKDKKGKKKDKKEKKGKKDKKGKKGKKGGDDDVSIYKK